MPIPAITPQVITPDHDHNRDRTLELALQAVLRPPGLPEGFRARILHAALQEQARDLDARKRALDVEYEQARQRLHHGYVRLSRDTLALVVVVSFAAGALANLSLPWLQSFLAIDLAVSAPMLALLVGLSAGASVCWDRLKA